MKFMSLSMVLPLPVLASRIPFLYLLSVIAFCSSHISSVVQNQTKRHNHSEYNQVEDHGHPMGIAGCNHHEDTGANGQEWHKIAFKETQMLLFAHHNDKNRNIHGIEGHNGKLRTVKAKRAKPGDRH